MDGTTGCQQLLTPESGNLRAAGLQWHPIVRQRCLEVQKKSDAVLSRKALLCSTLDRIVGGARWRWVVHDLCHGGCLRPCRCLRWCSHHQALTGSRCVCERRCTCRMPFPGRPCVKKAGAGARRQQHGKHDQTPDTKLAPTLCLSGNTDKDLCSAGPAVGWLVGQRADGAYSKGKPITHFDQSATSLPSMALR